MQKERWSMRMRGWMAGLWCWSVIATPLAARAQEIVTDPWDDEVAPMRVSMDFKDADLKDVLKTFSQQTGINLVASEAMGDKTITLYLDDVTVLDALDQILDAAGLVYERPVGSEIYIIKVKPKEETGPKTLTKVYKLRYARVSTSRLAKANDALGARTPFEAQQLTATTSGVGASSGVGTSISSVSGSGSSGETAEVGIDKVIRELLTEHGKLVVDERTNSVLVTDVPENFARIEAALHALDVKTAQVLIEAEVLETTLSKLKDVGFEWGTGTEGNLFTLTPGKRATRFPFFDQFAGEKGTAGTITNGSADFSPAVGVLQALRQDSETKILARPKILTLDNESAVIRLTAQQAVAIQSVSTTETGNLLAQTPERLTTGVILVVTPQVNERGFITMLIEPSVTKTVTSEISTSIVDPKTRSARSLVRLRDGQTLAMGGLIDRSDKHSVQEVPGLAGIPFIGGALFRNKEVKDSASEIVVFITPRIVKEPPGTTMASSSLMESSPIRTPPVVRQGWEQDTSASRLELIDTTLKRLEGRRL